MYYATIYSIMLPLESVLFNTHLGEEFKISHGLT